MTCAMNCTVCNYMSVVCGIAVYYRIPLGYDIQFAH